jgi:hypothetical protein
VPKTAGGGLVPLFAEEATTGEEVEIECIVEDDEWMRLAIQLTDAIFAEVKGLVVATLEEEDVKKLEDAGKKIEARVRVRTMCPTGYIPFFVLLALSHQPNKKSLICFCLDLCP